MDTTIEQQLAMDEAFVPTPQRCPFYKAFLVIADVPKIYMQEFWATTYVHQHSIRFKMDNKKHIVDLELFKDILHIYLRVHGQSFVETPFEEENLAFIRFLGYSAAIRMLTDVNINKLYQPWRSFAAIINKCLTGKSSGYDNLRLSQAQSLWGLYHKRNVDYAYLIKTMDTTIDQQVAMDEALIPTAQRLKIGRSNFRLLSDIKSKESTLQLVYDVLLICPFFKDFLVTSDGRKSICMNFGLQQLSIIIPFDSRWIIRSILLTW
nr:hypothetical protein [Tanacetum cinerariifolium]